MIVMPDKNRQRIVTMLRDVLADAESGKMRDCVILVEGDDGIMRVAWVGERTQAEKIGMMEIVKHLILTSCEVES